MFDYGGFQRLRTLAPGTLDLKNHTVNQDNFQLERGEPLRYRYAVGIDSTIELAVGYVDYGWLDFHMYHPQYTDRTNDFFTLSRDNQLLHTSGNGQCLEPNLLDGSPEVMSVGACRTTWFVDSTPTCTVPEGCPAPGHSGGCNPWGSNNRKCPTNGGCFRTESAWRCPGGKLCPAPPTDLEALSTQSVVA